MLYYLFEYLDKTLNISGTGQFIILDRYYPVVYDS
jgi:hypothetical protein